MTAGPQRGSTTTPATNLATGIIGLATGIIGLATGIIGLATGTTCRAMSTPPGGRSSATRAGVL